MLLLLTIAACTPEDTGTKPEETALVECDADGDGFCPDDGDCDDANAAISPAAQEICDPTDIDEDCSGDADDTDPNTTGKATFYLDADNDTYGDESYSQQYCNSQTGWSQVKGDCDDTDATTSPAGTEICDEANKDEDCDGLADDADEVTGGSTWYADTDGDGFGDAATTTIACDLPVGFSADATDCDDLAATTFPGAEEVCDDGLDNDCNTRADACGSGLEVDIPSTAWRIEGENADDGTSGVFPLGDLNGDGFPDFGLGATGVDHTGSGAGAVAVFYGPYAGATELSDADVLAYGGAASDKFGAACAAGDLLGGDTPDLVCSSPGAARGAGGAWVFEGPLDPELITTGAQVGVEVSTAGAGVGSILLVGDFSGDGLEDLVTGGASIQTAWRFDGPLAEGMYDETGGTASWREGGIGRSPSATAAADLDGDGILDLAFGDDGDSGDAGAVWIASGGTAGDVTLSSNSDASILGTAAGKLGSAVSGGGDANGDGYADLAVGASSSDAGGTVLIFHGPFLSDIDDSAASVELYARATGTGAGSALSWGSDLDGDALPDLAIGQPADNDVGAAGGSVSVVYSPLNWSGSLDAADLIYLPGAAGDAAGTNLATTDVDGDGVDNLLIASPGADGSIASNVGAVDLVY